MLRALEALSFDYSSQSHLRRRLGAGAAIQYQIPESFSRAIHFGDQEHSAIPPLSQEKCFRQTWLALSYSARRSPAFREVNMHVNGPYPSTLVFRYRTPLLYSANIYTSIHFNGVSFERGEKVEIIHVSKPFVPLNSPKRFNVPSSP
jgi:hypothetical protein